MNQLTEGIFTGIYRSGIWRKMTPAGESHSGPGSTLAATKVVRDALPTIVKQFGIKTVLDVPCGDFNWMQHVELGAEYIGADIVRELVEYNVKTYAAPGRKFVQLDLMTDPLPQAELILCRDCFGHFCIEDAWLAIENIRRSSARYLLATTYTKRHANPVRTHTGNWYPCALHCAPFRFPAPLRVYNERCCEAQMRVRDKSLGLWRVADIPARET